MLLATKIINQNEQRILDNHNLKNSEAWRAIIKDPPERLEEENNVMIYAYSKLEDISNDHHRYLILKKIITASNDQSTLTNAAYCIDAVDSSSYKLELLTILFDKETPDNPLNYYHIFEEAKHAVARLEPVHYYGLLEKYLTEDYDVSRVLLMDQHLSSIKGLNANDLPNQTDPQKMIEDIFDKVIEKYGYTAALFSNISLIEDINKRFAYINELIKDADQQDLGLCADYCIETLDTFKDDQDKLVSLTMAFMARKELEQEKKRTIIIETINLITNTEQQKRMLDHIDFSNASNLPIIDSKCLKDNPEAKSHAIIRTVHAIDTNKITANIGIFEKFINKTARENYYDGLTDQAKAAIIYVNIFNLTDNNTNPSVYSFDIIMTIEDKGLKYNLAKLTVLYAYQHLTIPDFNKLNIDQRYIPELSTIKSKVEKTFNYNYKGPGLSTDKKQQQQLVSKAIFDGIGG